MEFLLLLMLLFILYKCIFLRAGEVEKNFSLGLTLPFLRCCVPTWQIITLYIWHKLTSIVLLFVRSLHSTLLAYFLALILNEMSFFLFCQLLWLFCRIERGKTILLILDSILLLSFLHSFVVLNRKINQNTARRVLVIISHLSHTSLGILSLFATRHHSFPLLSLT